MRRSGKLTPLKESRDDMMANVDFQGQFSTSLQTMQRSLAEPIEKFPKTQVPNTSLPTGGITESSEANLEEGKAELEVLKAILNREGYLNRLQRSARTVNKKFKPEVADILDLVRAATLDVVECIVRWREAKRDHDAAFMWNQVNYLLKMPSDLDYLAKYLAIERHVGFGLRRNPFVVPSPLEDGVSMYKDLIINPAGLTGGTPQDGFMIIGGISQSRLESNYKPSTQTLGANGSVDRGDPTVTISPYGRPPKKTKAQIEKEARQSVAKSNSFVMNSDMKKIRMAELVCLKEEDKFGRWARDPSDRLVPLQQAKARLAAVELVKDEKRPIHKPSLAGKEHAPHSASSDIGVVVDSWVPSEAPKSKQAESRYLETVDHDVIAIRRGEGKIGGQLAPLDAKGVDTRIRKPLRTNVASTMEFARYRRKRLLGERLAEIDELRQEIQRQKEALEDTKKKAMQKKREYARNNVTSRGARQGSHSPMSRGRSAGLGDRPRSVGFSGTEPLPDIVDEKGAEDEIKAASPTTGSPSSQGRSSRSPSPTSAGVAAGSPLVKEGSEIDLKAPPSVAPAPEGDREAEQLKEEFATIRDTFVKYESGLQSLKEEEKGIFRELEHIEADDDRMLAIKSEEQRMVGVERSRDIERKRRHLTAEQGQRKGPPPPEASNAYDYYAIKVQATIRGWLAKCFTKWFRVASSKACNIIQAAIRGKLGRLRVAKYRLEFFAQQQIAKIYRGYKARGVAASAAGAANVGKSALLIQKCFRGFLGRERAKSKAKLDAAATVARESVDPRALLASDVRELGLRIQYAVEEPETSSFPPDEVLYLVRLCTVVIQQSRGLMGMSEYNFINARFHGEVEGETMTWQQASRFLNRAERMMRLLRALAYGPGEKPPRLVQLSPATLLLYAAQTNNPRWKKETFEQMGMGSKFATQLFMWSASIYEVSSRQAEFGAFLTSSFPDWLPMLYGIHAKSRDAECSLEAGTRCVDTLKEYKVRNKDDPIMNKLLDESIKEVNQEIEESSATIEGCKKDEVDLMTKQGNRETLALASMEAKLQEMNQISSELTAEFNETNAMAQTGNTKAKEDLGSIRSRLTEHQLSLKALDGQLRLLTAQVTQNTHTRAESHPLPIDIRVKAAAAGEGRAAEMLEMAKIACFLDEQGVRHADHLEPFALRQYHVLDEKRRDAHKETWRLQKEAEVDRKKFDTKLNDMLVENQKKEIASKDRVAPSDEEMEEERREDEEQARRERMKSIQFIPDVVMHHEHPDRPRPCIVALGRDLPEHCKNRIIGEVTRMMPGLFVFLDCPENMGLDIREMQSVFDAKKCIIMMVDHGLARSSRLNFLKSFAVTIKALIPNPFVTMVVGDDKNCRTTANSHYGTAKQDIQLLRDCDIKVALEGMAWVVREIQDPSIQKIMVQRSTLVESPSQEFVNVCEAVFCLLLGADGGEVHSPESTLKAMSWRFTARTLGDPVKLATKLRAVKRGKSDIKFVQTLNEYVKGQYWPAPGCNERQSDPVMHMLALFVELFIRSESCTLNRGGMPVQALARGSATGVQSVEVVTDSEDPDDMLSQDHSTGWRMTSAKIIRTALQDLRTMKCVMKINNVLLNVSAYKEDQMLYFDTYNAANSEVHICQVPQTDVPFLLMPSQETVDTVGRPKPPQNKVELYQHLAKLLKLEPILKSAAHSRKTLICRRDYTLLRKFKTKLNGHSAFIKCFEAALGQLYFNCWLSESGAELNFLLEERGRLELLTNADPELEAQYVYHNDARKLLNLATDRLKLSPSATMMRIARNGEAFNKAAYRKKQGLLSDIRAQGYMLKVRTRRGPGRGIFRRVIHISGVMHLLDVLLNTFTKMLIVRVYEPKRRHKMEYRMPQYLRKIMLGTESDDFKRWDEKLMKRLKINWRGEHSVYLDTTISRRVRRIHGKRMLVKLVVHDADSVQVILVDNEISTTFEAIVNREQFVRILLYEHVGDVIKRDFGVEVQKDSIRNILNEMARGPTLQPGEVREEQPSKGGIDPMLFEIPLMDILCHHEQLVWFSKQLELCLQRMRENNAAFGYVMRNPVHIEFIPPPKPTNLAEMTTDMRFESYFRYSENLGDHDSVIRCRKQPQYKYMEEELNDLALRLKRAAEQKAEEDRRAAEDFERKLLGLQTEYEKEEEEKAAREAQAAEEEWLRKREEERASKILAEDASSAEQLTTENTNEEVAESKSDSSSRPATATAAGKKVPEFDLDAVIDEAAYLTADNLVQAIEEKNQNRMIERAQPGTTQEVRRLDIMSGDGKGMVSVPAEALTVEQRAILGRGERKVFEGGSKTTFRDTRASWSGHVAVTVYETLCWMGDDGLGKRLKFEVYEPGSASTYVSYINNLNHCTRILGKHGLDLLDPAKTTEMILFIIKFRMRVVDNRITWDGEPNEADAPAYRIEFETVRVYDDEKVTPVDVGGEADEYANKDKLFEAEKKRGKKIVRLVKRVNGVLMQLTVFEVTTTPELLMAIQDSKIASASLQEEEEEKKQADSMANFDPQKGRAETRISTTLKRHTPPTLKIVGYDPRSKRKATMVAPPAAILEVAGGIYSPYLEYGRRRELAKIACESLSLNFPKGKPFELIMLWSGTAKEAAGAALAKAPTKGKSIRSTAEAVLKRPGKLFRTAMVLGQLECIVTLYQQNAPGQEDSAKGYVEKQLIVNVYARAASEATEIVITDQEQTERIGRTIASFPEGEMRSAGVRRLMRFLHAALIDDLEADDVTKKVVHLVMRPPNKDFLTEYMQTKPTPPGEDIRPTGIPAVFLPLDTCGTFLYRCSMQLANKAKKGELSDYIITVYSKSETEGPERGLVIKIYERDTSVTCILHLGPSEMTRLLDRADEPELLRDLVVAQNMANAEKLDNVEQRFLSVSPKGELVNKAQQMCNHMTKIILADLAVTISPDQQLIPYLLSRGTSKLIQ